MPKLGTYPVATGEEVADTDRIIGKIGGVTKVLTPPQLAAMLKGPDGIIQNATTVAAVDAGGGMSRIQFTGTFRGRKYGRNFSIDADNAVNGDHIYLDNEIDTGGRIQQGKYGAFLIFPDEYGFDGTSGGGLKYVRAVAPGGKATGTHDQSYNTAQDALDAITAFGPSTGANSDDAVGLGFFGTIVIHAAASVSGGWLVLDSQGKWNTADAVSVTVNLYTPDIADCSASDVVDGPLAKLQHTLSLGPIEIPSSYGLRAGDHTKVDYVGRVLCSDYGSLDKFIALRTTGATQCSNYDSYSAAAGKYALIAAYVWCSGHALDEHGISLVQIGAYDTENEAAEAKEDAQTKFYYDGGLIDTEFAPGMLFDGSAIYQLVMCMIAHVGASAFVVGTDSFDPSDNDVISCDYYPFKSHFLGSIPLIAAALREKMTPFMDFSACPTTDPAVAGLPWIDVADGRTLKVSAG